MNDRGTEGRRILAATLGEAYAAKRDANTNAFNRPLREVVEEFAFGTIWARDVLPYKTRSLMCIALLSALNRPQELELHIVSALNAGASVEEIRETLLHVIPYSGIPASVEAFKVAERVLRAQGRLDELGNPLPASPA